MTKIKEKLLKTQYFVRNTNGKTARYQPNHWQPALPADCCFLKIEEIYTYFYPNISKEKMMKIVQNHTLSTREKSVPTSNQKWKQTTSPTTLCQKKHTILLCSITSPYTHTKELVAQQEKEGIALGNALAK